MIKKNNNNNKTAQQIPWVPEDFFRGKVAIVSGEAAIEIFSFAGHNGSVATKKKKTLAPRVQNKKKFKATCWHGHLRAFFSFNSSESTIIKCDYF